MKTATLALFCAAGALAFGQSVPEIPFDSNPDFFKLPDDLHFGETSGVAVNSQGQVYVYSRGNTTGPAYGATASQIFCSIRTANTSAKSARICTPGPSRTPSGWIAKTTSGPSIKARI